MAKTTERAFALTLAILFLVTSVGFSGYVIWQMYDQSKNPPKDDKQTAQTNQQEQPVSDKKIKNFEPMGDTRVTELKITDIKVGDGAEAKPDSTVLVKYTGALTKTGMVFDSTESRGGEPAEFPLDGVIKGFKEGIAGMKVGGERRILIPASLGYGNQEGGPIPADSDLVFDVTLVEVK